MSETASSLLSYPSIVRARERLRAGEALAFDERQRYAASVVSVEDIVLLKTLVAVGRDPQIADEVALALFTRGGMGNLNAELRGWLELMDDPGIPAVDSAPLLLAEYVKQLYDGTALRQLHEFSYKDNVRMSLQQVVQHVEPSILDRLLRQSVFEQVDQLIDRHGEFPTNRFLWTLRTYRQHERVREYLAIMAKAGRVSALASYALTADPVDWKFVYAAKPQDEFDLRVVVNVALENIARGASNRANASSIRNSLPTAAKGEFDVGIESL